MIGKENTIIFSKIMLYSTVVKYTIFLQEYVRHIILLDMENLSSEMWKNLTFHPSSFIPISCLDFIFYMYSMLQWT